MQLPKFSNYFVLWSEYQELKNRHDALKNEIEISSMFSKELTYSKEASYVDMDGHIISDIPQLRDNLDIPVAGFDTTDEEPTDPLARKQYLMDVDYFMDTVLNRKLKCSIADIREMLSNIGVARGLPQNMQRNEYDFFLRGMEAFAWKMHEWATLLQAERRSSLQDKENNNGSI